MRVFHVDVEGNRKGGFHHCQNKSRTILGGKIANEFFGLDTIFDPVDEAEFLYSPDPCHFALCDLTGVTVVTDPQTDRILAPEECGNAAAVALRYEETVTDGVLTIELTRPDAGEPASPDGNPKISGISIRPSNVTPCPFQPPVNVAADGGCEQVTVSWEEPASGPAPEKYVVLRDGAEIAVVDAPATSYLDEGLAHETEYKYVVRSRGANEDAECDSAPSGEASATTKTEAECAQPNFKRGDADTNGSVELTDVIRALTWQFVGGVDLPCQDAADIDDDGAITLTDAIRSLNYQFVGVPNTIPEPPGPATCGPDPSPDGLPECVYPAENCQ